MPWTIDDIPDLSGTISVVTGANGGLGLATAEALAGAGSHVVMAVRNQEKAARAVDRIRSVHPDAALELVPLDLGDLASVRKAVEQIAGVHETIDILVNNAGVMATPEGTTADGFETQFGTNHLGHWVFDAGLLPSVLRAEAGRVVTVTSAARFMTSHFSATDPHLRKGYRAWRAYGQAKLSNYYFGLGLHDRFRAAGVRTASILAHPGLTNSDLQSTAVHAGGGGFIGSASEVVAEWLGMSVADGARSQIRAATDPGARSGTMYGPLFTTNGPPVVRPIIRPGNRRAIDALWRVSEAETGVTIDVGALAEGLAES